MIPIETGVKVSQYAMNLVMAGKAYFGSGGVRLIENDRFVELYRLLPSYQTQQPGIMPINPFIPALPAPAATAVQAVNVLPQIANVVLSYKNGQKLNRVINMLSSLQGIAWANTAIGAANMALTVMNFTVINSKLNGLAQQITSAVADLKREMKAIQLEDKTIEILTLIDNLKSTSHYLSIQQLNRQDEIQIEKFLNSAKQLILWLEDQFEVASPPESGTLFSLLFDLTSMYTSVLKEYGAQYFYLESCFPGNFAGWIEIFNFVDAKALQSGLKRTIWLANPVATTEKLESTYDFTLNTIHLQYQELQEVQEVIPQLSREAYFDFDIFVKKKIDTGEVEIIEHALDEDPRERVLLGKNGFAAL